MTCVPVLTFCKASFIKHLSLFACVMLLVYKGKQKNEKQMHFISYGKIKAFSPEILIRVSRNIIKI